MTAQGDARFAGEEYLRHIMLDYRQMTEFVKEPFLVARADGIRFWDVYGKEYLDGLAGIFTVNVGYNNPRVLEAVRRQLETLPFNPPMHGTNPRAVELANLLAEITPGRPQHRPAGEQRLGGERGRLQDGPAVPPADGEPGQVQDPLPLPELPRGHRQRHERRGRRLPQDPVRAGRRRLPPYLPAVLLPLPLREDLSGLRRVLRPDRPAP